MYLTIKLVHFASILGLFLAIGGLIATDKKKPSVVTKYVILHGLSLLLIFLTGFAMQGIGKLGFPHWLLAKIGVWALLGATLVLLKREKVSPTVGWLLSIGLGALSAYLVTFKPIFF